MTAPAPAEGKATPEGEACDLCGIATGTVELRDNKEHLCALCWDNVVSGVYDEPQA